MRAPANMPATSTEIDVNQVIRDYTGTGFAHAEIHPFQLVLELDATNAVTINEQELQQVLVNLISNAVHALPEIGAGSWWPPATGNNGACASLLLTTVPA